MTRDLIPLAVLLALCVLCLTVLTIGGTAVPVVLEAVTYTLAGAVAGGAVTRKETRP